MSPPTPREASGSLAGWLPALLGLETLPEEGREVELQGARYVMRDGILRSTSLVSEAQQQTSSSFGYQWQKRELYDRPEVRAEARRWLLDRYGDPRQAPWLTQGAGPKLVLDAGCGAGFSAHELFDGLWDRIRYLGADISAAVDVARARIGARTADCAFLQADLTRLPLPPACADVIFSEGVLHHTDSTEGALKALAPLLRPGGRFLFYVYRKKAPIREFTDDYIRERLQELPPEEAWAALLPLTRLGKALGDLDVEVEVPEDVPLLGIPAGRVKLQRLFYWYLFKIFYRPEWSVEQMNNTNFDWYAPRNAHRQSPEEVRRWCAEAGLEIERERLEEAGITIVARRRGD